MSMINYEDKVNKYKSTNITFESGRELLTEFDNKEAFKFFIEIYKNQLYNQHILAYKLFKIYYCFSVNIYNQILESKYDFKIQEFLFNLKKKGVNFIEHMNTEEKEIYDNLDKRIKIYRGMCQQEEDSGKYGISWTTDKEIAKSYSYSPHNNVPENEGGLKSGCIDKTDILTVFGNKEKIELIVLTDYIKTSSK